MDRKRKNKSSEKKPENRKWKKKKGKKNNLRLKEIVARKRRILEL